MDFKVDISDDACMKLVRIIDNVDSKQLAKDDAEIELLMLGKKSMPPLDVLWCEAFQQRKAIVDSW